MKGLNAVQKKITMCKRVGFYCKQRNMFIPRHLTLMKSLKRLLQNIYLMLEFLYHKLNPLITNVVRW